MVLRQPTVGIRPRVVALLAAAIVVTVSAVPAAAAPTKPGFRTGQAAMLTGLAPGSSVIPIITVGDTIGGYRFESIPDGISILPHGRGTVDVFVNHETSAVPFPVATSAAGWQPTTNRNGSQSDFENSQVSLLRIHQQSMGVLEASYAIPSSANYQRFCSNFLATAEHGFDRPILFTNEEATDFVFRTGQAYPAPASEPPAEQAGVAVAYDVNAGTYHTIYGMGRHNHENSVAIPGYDELVVLSGDDTFSAPSSQLYSYIAADTAAVLDDTGTLYAFKSNDPNVNDYGDVSISSGTVSGTFIPVPPNVARGPQAGLESWSNTNNVFQFIRVEDTAYDRANPNVVYIADTGEPRALRHATDPGPNRLSRGPSGTMGPFPNGRIWKMTLNASDPRVVDNLEVLVDADAFGYGSPATLHNPDNLETTANSLLIQEDPGSHNSGPMARIWRLDLATEALVPVAQVNQSADGGPTDEDGFANEVGGYWESSGIVDVSSVFGPGSFLVTIQAHSLWVDKAPSGDNNTWLSPNPPAYTTGPDGHTDWMFKREGGQLVLLRIPGA